MKLIILTVVHFACGALCSISDDFIGNVFSASWSQSNEKYSNVLVSPFSLVAPLGTLAIASHGQTHKEILHALDIKKTKSLSESYLKALRDLENDNSINITTANRVYVTRESNINPDFYEDAREKFDIEVVNINFRQPEKTASSINNWVAKKTNGLITELVSPNSIQPATRVMLVNTIYFQAKWAKSFRYAGDHDFIINKSTKLSVPYMTVEQKMPYINSKQLKAEVIMIPYRNSQCSFMIIHPHHKVDIYSIRRQLTNRNLLGEATQAMKITDVKLFMPKFEFENRIDLKHVLKKLNIKEVFTSNANISRMTMDDQSLNVNSAYQKAFIRVNEEGTQAAAANVLNLFEASAKVSPPKEVVINTPFYFDVGCSETSVFSGILFRP